METASAPIPTIGSLHVIHPLPLPCRSVKKLAFITRGAQAERDAERDSERTKWRQALQRGADGVASLDASVEMGKPD